MSDQARRMKDIVGSLAALVSGEAGGQPQTAAARSGGTPKLLRPPLRKQATRPQLTAPPAKPSPAGQEEEFTDF
jgi:hypothetical protein